MPSPSWTLTEQDQLFFARELDAFVPTRLYDAHVHLGRQRDYGPLHAELTANTPKVADLAAFRSHCEWNAPGRELGGAMIISTAIRQPQMQPKHFAWYVRASSRRWPRSR